MYELSGNVIESVSQTRKSEWPEDQMRVLQGYCHVVMYRIHAHSIFDKLQQVAKIPIINGLSDDYHPCQILADLLTLKEKFGSLNGLSIAYIGDGNNILHSLLLMAPKLGIKVRYACPNGHQPKQEIVSLAQNSMIEKFQTPEEAVADVHAVYTDGLEKYGG